MNLRFGPFALDTRKYELTCGGEVRPVEPMVFDLLALLARNPERIFSRDELIEEIWQGRSVSDATVSTCVKNARRALGDSGEQQTYIRTVRGRGFLFAAEVTTDPASPAPESVRSSTPGVPGRGDRDDLSLIVLPLQNLSDDREHRHLAERLGARLGTILTRVPLLRLNAQAGRYRALETPPTSEEIHLDLGVDFVLGGSIQAFGADPTADLQLTDARTGFSLWAESFGLPAPPGDGLDQTVAAMIGKLEPQLHRAMYTAARTTPGEPSARQLFLEASGILVLQGWHHESFPKAIRLLEQSAALDPDLAVAPALLALLTGFGARIGLATGASAGAEAAQWAERALRADSMDSTVLGYAGCCLADIGEVDRGETILRSAIDLNPSNAQALAALGAVRMTRGDLESAVRHLETGIEISPVDSRLSVWGALLAVAYLLSGDREAAIHAAETACRRNDRTYLPRIALAAARMAAGDEAAARAALADARRIKPDLVAHQIAALVGPKWASRVLEIETRDAGEESA